MQNLNGKSALGLDINITVLLSYIIGLVALILLFIEKDNKFVRFHAIQSLLYGVVACVVMIALSFFIGITAFISGTLAGLISALFGLIWIGFLIGLVYFGYKAYQGEKFKLPVIGDLADKWA